RLHRAFLITPIPGINCDLKQRWIIGLAERQALPDPTQNLFVRFRADLETLSTLVLDAKRGLLQDQAFFRAGRENPPPAIRFDDVLVIRFWIEREDREFESVLAIGFGMA